MVENPIKKGSKMNHQFQINKWNIVIVFLLTALFSHHLFQSEFGAYMIVNIIQ